MRRMLLVLQYELATTVSRPSFLFGVLGVPLIAGLLLLGLPALAGRSTSVSPAASEGQALAVEGYVDLAGLIEAIPADMPAGTLLRYASEARARDALRTGEIRAYYVIPAGYLASGDLIYVNPDYSIAGDHGQSWVMQRTLLANLLGNDPELIVRASQATILVIWPLVLSVVVAILNYETPHAPLVVALSLFPLCAPVMMMTRLVAGGVPWWQPPLAAGLMLVTAVLVIRGAAGMFRAQVLLSGQPFTARRFLAALAGRA